MPSDDRARRALDAVSGKVEAFRSAVALTADQLRGQLAGVRARSDGEASRAAAELGPFAAGRIDVERFSQLLAGTEPPSGDWTEQVERAVGVLEEIESRGDELFHVSVERGGDLQAAVERSLAEAGRAFGAARVAELARSSRYRPEEHDGLLDAFPFRHWSKSERELAPPLVIEVDGGDLLVGGLGAYLDGSQDFILLVDGHAPPAPLARLISPGVLVLQTDAAEALRCVGEAAGPAVAALMPSSAGRFMHEPTADGGTGRLEVEHLPEREPRRPLGSLSAFQQQQDLRLLATLAEQAARTAATAAASANGTAESVEVVAAAGEGVPAASTVPPAPPAPADVLAAWLLEQADLTDIGG